MHAYRGQFPRETTPAFKARIVGRCRPVRLAARLGAFMLPFFALIVCWPFSGTEWTLEGWGFEGRLAGCAFLAMCALRAYIIMLADTGTWR